MGAYFVRRDSRDPLYRRVLARYVHMAVAGGLAQELGTFGFRGEALSSLCALAEVGVVTRTAELAAGVRLAFDQGGAVVSQASAARATGTTVALKDLFKPLPVRYKVELACDTIESDAR